MGLSHPAGGGGQSAQPTRFLPPQPFTDSADPDHHGLAERFRAKVRKWRIRSLGCANRDMS